MQFLFEDMKKRIAIFFAKQVSKKIWGMKLQIEMQNEPEREGTFNQETKFLLKVTKNENENKTAFRLL